jgi:hypothetical protein
LLTDKTILVSSRHRWRKSDLTPSLATVALGIVLWCFAPIPAWSSQSETRLQSCSIVQAAVL